MLTVATLSFFTHYKLVCVCIQDSFQCLHMVRIIVVDDPPNFDFFFESIRLFLLIAASAIDLSPSFSKLSCSRRKNTRKIKFSSLNKHNEDLSRQCWYRQLLQKLCFSDTLRIVCHNVLKCGSINFHKERKQLT